MSRLQYLCGGSAVVLTLALIVGSAQAQEKPSTVEEVIVTGSFIAGTAKDTAIPVAVRRRHDQYPRPGRAADAGADERAAIRRLYG